MLVTHFQKKFIKITYKAALIDGTKNSESAYNNMDKDNSSKATNLLRPSTLLTVEALNSRLQQHSATAAGRSTRMIIDSASYVTTPCSSPPNELRDFFSAKDDHHKAADVPSQIKVDDIFKEQLGQQEVGKRTHHSTGGSQVPGSHNHQGVIPPFMLQAISGSDAAGPRVRVTTAQTLASSEDIDPAHGDSAQASQLVHQNSDSREPEGRP